MNYYNSFLSIFFLALIVSASSAADASSADFKYIKYEKGSIVTNLAIQDSLPKDLISYLNKGVPVSFTYEIEIWKDRPGWFDKQIDKASISYRVRYDRWEKQYSVIQTSGDLIIENILKGERETIDLVSSSGTIPMVVEDTAGAFYVIGKMTIKTLSFSNYKEVESWLKGGISDAKKPELQEAPDKFGEFIFDVALKISGLKDISDEVKSREFRINQLPLIYPQ